MIQQVLELVGAATFSAIVFFCVTGVIFFLFPLVPFFMLAIGFIVFMDQ